MIRAIEWDDSPYFLHGLSSGEVDAAAVAVAKHGLCRQWRGGEEVPTGKGGVLTSRQRRYEDGRRATADMSVCCRHVCLLHMHA